MNLVGIQSETRVTGQTAVRAAPLELEQLQRRCLGRLDLVERLLASFERRFPVELLEIQQCLAEGNLERLTLLSHQMKGAAANIGAPSLQRLMHDMEDAARTGRLDEAEKCLTKLQGEWERFTEYRGSVCSL